MPNPTQAQAQPVTPESLFGKPVDEKAVERNQRPVDTRIVDALGQIHDAHPTLSPWYPIPGDTEAEVKTALRKIRDAAKTLGAEGRRVLTGKHAKSGKAVFALGGKPLARKSGQSGVSTTVSAETQEMPDGQPTA